MAFHQHSRWPPFSSFSHRCSCSTYFVVVLALISWHAASEVSDAAAVEFNASQITSNRSHLPSREPASWMKAPLFHSPKPFAADYYEMKQNFKLFAYPHASAPEDSESRMFGYHSGKYLPKGNYASEAYFFRNLYESELLTQDPSEANVFVLPFSILGVRMAIGPAKAKDWVAEYMEGQLKQKWPYWNRSGGADHLYATCHDLGVQAAATAPGLSGGALQIICPANRWHKNFIPTKDFSYPQIWPRYKEAEPGGLSAAERKASKVLAFWSGSQNSRVRAALKSEWDDDDEILLGGGRVLKEQQRGKDYFANFRRAKYCLHAAGYQVHTGRIGDAIYFGCVPVILADQYDLPFKDVLDWRELAVIVAESNVPNLKTILKSIPDERYERLHANVQTVRRLFTWNTPPQDYDIFHITMYEIWMRRFVTRPSLELR